ncbi:TPA: hypothetical protein DEF17_09000 [bacterium]|nr:hypothetical protein [bacterium]
MGRNRSSIGREIKRNLPPQKNVRYRANRAQKRFEERSAFCHARDWIKNSETRQYVETKLKEGWTPEIIASRLPLDDSLLSTNYESIYQ